MTTHSALLLVPWTRAQVSALNRYQLAGHLHPYTCGNEHDGERVLIATRGGWRCPSCDYTQEWAHVSSTDPALLINPLCVVQEQEATDE